jgi:uncharacterized membrane protein
MFHLIILIIIFDLLISFVFNSSLVDSLQHMRYMPFHLHGLHVLLN